MKTINCEFEKSINIFDGLIPLEQRTLIYRFCRQSKFQLGWSNSIEPEKSLKNSYLYSLFNESDVESLGIVKYIQCSEIENILQDYTHYRTVLNLSIATDSHCAHIHNDEKVLLYYVNLTWQDGFHGETVFHSEDLSGIQFSSPYVPGRILIFDASIPHSIRPQSITAPEHRFTLSFCFKKNKTNASYWSGSKPLDRDLFPQSTI